MAVGNSAMKSGGVMYNFGYPISSNSEFYVFGGYNNKNGRAAGVYRYPGAISSNAKVYAPNVFGLYPNGFLPEIVTDISDFSTAAGFRTKFSGWNLDISNTYGINKFNFNVENSVNYTQFSDAAAGKGQTKFDAGGVRFWQNTVNADIVKKFDVAEGLNVAGGFEYRVDAFGIVSGEEASYKNYDPASTATAGAQVFAGFLNTGDDINTRNSKAAYVDLELDITEKLLVEGAARYENYSDFGSTMNFKGAARYKITDNLSIRGSVSTGFRAPSMQQRFYAKTNTLFVSQGGNLVPIQAGTSTNDSEPAQILGIPKLKQETSRNYSIGLTSTPFKGLELTIDAYQIDIDNRIVLTNNFTGGKDSALIAQLSAAGANTANFFSNSIDTRARGLEAVASYTKSFASKHFLRTTLAMTFIDNEVIKEANGKPVIHASGILVNAGQLGNYFNREDQSRFEVANPKNKFSLTFNYKINKFGAMLRFVRFGKVTYLDPSINPDSTQNFPVNAFTGNKETLDQTFAAKTVTDLSLSYQIVPEVLFTIGANNLFNVYQDRHTHSGNMSLGRFVYSRRVQQMGFNGAYYFARLRFALNTNK
jgi:iron complex outermembrane receptor protein